MSHSSNENVLLLGDRELVLQKWLLSQGENVVHTSDRITPEFLDTHHVKFLVSYGYRHIIKEDVLSRVPGRAINLHISYLPWNRGADPNFWSVVEQTPKGVTIHFLDKGVDTGDIIAQQLVDIDLNIDTLATSYQKLQKAIQDLFMACWHDIKAGRIDRKVQVGSGTLHRTKDKDVFANILNQGWDTPLVDVLNMTQAQRV